MPSSDPPASLVCAGAFALDAPLRLGPDPGARIRPGHFAQTVEDVRVNSRCAGFTRITDKRVYRVPTDPRDDISQTLYNVRQRPRVGMLIEQLETASPNDRTWMAQAPDERIDALR